jgi:hypothetical protein
MAALTFLYWPWAATPDLVVEGGSASERRLDFHLADALRLPTPSQAHHGLQLDTR